MKSTITYLIIIVLVALGAYWGYTKFSSSGSAPVAGVTVTTADGTIVPSDDATKQANEFIQILQNVNEVTLNDLSLLSNPIFSDQLQDYGKAIEDRPIGRPNPFAPVTGLDAIKKATSTNATTTAEAGSGLFIE